MEFGLEQTSPQAFKRTVILLSSSAGMVSHIAYKHTHITYLVIIVWNATFICRFASF